MRIAFEDDDWQKLYTDPDFRLPRVGPEVTRAYRKKVGLLVAVSDQQELRNHKSLHLEKLKGSREDQHSIRLNKQWRLILRFIADEDGQVALIIDVVDYH